MKKTVFKVKRTWLPKRPVYIPERMYASEKEDVEETIMNDVYFLELIANSTCDRKTVASILLTSFSDIRVMHADSGSQTLPVGEKLEEFCLAMETLLQSWPKKVVVVGSPEFCWLYAKKTGQAVGDRASRLSQIRPEKRVIMLFPQRVTSDQFLTWQSAIENSALVDAKTGGEYEHVDDNPFSLHQNVCDIAVRHFALVRKKRAHKN